MRILPLFGAFFIIFIAFYVYFLLRSCVTLNRKEWFHVSKHL
nr:MAG TPA: protein of unknown function (DUF4519) [Caudoviricetes sp.]